MNFVLTCFEASDFKCLSIILETVIQMNCVSFAIVDNQLQKREA